MWAGETQKILSEKTFVIILLMGVRYVKNFRLNIGLETIKITTNIVKYAKRKKI